MRRIKLLCDIGRFKAGWGIEVEDAVAAMYVQQGKAVYGPADMPLKKGNLENYNNCIPLTPKEIAAKQAAATPKTTAMPPPVVAPVEDK